MIETHLNTDGYSNHNIKIFSLEEWRKMNKEEKTKILSKAEIITDQ
jgi:hypothetical protein